jgi:hypothetical protein
MFKRTKGYFLLTMLVLTGLAGRLHSNILTTKERHELVVELKTSKNEFLKSVDDLSSKQFNFKPEPNSLSIKQCVYKVISIENNLWKLTQESLKQENSQLQKTNSDNNLTFIVQEKNFQFNTIKFKTVKEALKFYKNERSAMLKYVHTSTENVRGHVAQTNLGNFDAYQLMLLNTIYCKSYIKQIEEIKAHPNFPK